MNWTLSFLITNKKEKYLSRFIQYILLTITFFIPGSILVSLISNLLVTINQVVLIPIIITTIILIISYFMHTSFALIPNYNLKEFKKHIIQTFKSGIKLKIFTREKVVLNENLLKPIFHFLLICKTFFYGHLFLLSVHLQF